MRWDGILLSCVVVCVCIRRRSGGGRMAWVGNVQMGGMYNACCRFFYLLLLYHLERDSWFELDDLMIDGRVGGRVERKREMMRNGWKMNGWIWDQCTCVVAKSSFLGAVYLQIDRWMDGWMDDEGCDGDGDDWGGWLMGVGKIINHVVIADKSEMKWEKLDNLKIHWCIGAFGAGEWSSLRVCKRKEKELCVKQVNEPDLPHCLLFRTFDFILVKQRKILLGKDSF